MTILLPPSSNLAYGKPVTVTVGTPHPSYPASNLTDGWGQTPLRTPESTMKAVVDLGSAQAPTVAALFGHNISAAATVTLVGSSSPTLSPALRTVSWTREEYAMWADLSLLPTSAQYWGISVANNGQSVVLGELVLGVGLTLDGVIEPTWTKKVQINQDPAVSVGGTSYRIMSGGRNRALQLALRLYWDQLTVLYAVFEDAGLVGGRVVVVPDSRVSDAFYAEWPASRITVVDNHRVSRVSLDLLEESFGVVNEFEKFTS